MKEIMKIQKIFVEFMSKGRPDADGLPYKFPVITANFKKTDLNDKEELESDWFEYIARINHKGFMNINTSPRFAMCCRLNIDQFKFNSFGGGGLKLGSFRVINVNLPKFALESNDIFEFFELLKHYLIEAHQLLNVERLILKEKIEQGFLKFFTLKWFDLDNMFFGTLSFHGLADAIEILIDEDMTHKYSNELTNQIIELFLEEASKETEYYINIEQAPSESATNTMARMNRDSREWYSNQFVPLEFPISIEERIKIEGMFSDKLTGGSMCFINLDGQMDEEQSLLLHKYIYENSMINQWAPNYGWSVCDKTHTTNGEIEECPQCESTDIKHYERVVGYLVDRNAVNHGRELEMLNRMRHVLST
jgi:anaerobic ribonucleoside-triphosphate reductase